MPASPEQLLALLEAPHFKTPGSTSRKTEGPTARRTEGQAAVNLTVVDHVAEGRQVLARAEKLSAEGSSLGLREAYALREAQAMKSEALLGMNDRIRTHACPACGCWTLLPRNGRAFCVSRHCGVGGRQRRWEYRELAFIGPGTAKRVERTDTERPPRDAMDLQRLLMFFAPTGRPMSDATLRRLIKGYNLPRWDQPTSTRAYLYSLSDVATAHALHMAAKANGDCTTVSSSRPPCTGLADLFFTACETPAARESAKKLCAVCPLKQACLDTALTHTEYDQHGIYGGLTARERRTLKKTAVNA